MEKKQRNGKMNIKEISLYFFFFYMGHDLLSHEINRDRIVSMIFAALAALVTYFITLWGKKRKKNL